MTGASYSYDEKNKMYVSYDTVNMTKVKAGYIKMKGLAGGMWWETSMDRVGENSLIGTVCHIHFFISMYLYNLSACNY